MCGGLYAYDLSQWRTHSTDFLTKHRVKTSENEKPECSLIELEDTHEGIISKELFEKAQEIREHRSRLVNWIEIQRLYDYIDKLKAILDENEIDYLEI